MGFDVENLIGAGRWLGNSAVKPIRAVLEAAGCRVYRVG